MMCQMAADRTAADPLVRKVTTALLQRCRDGKTYHCTPGHGCFAAYDHLHAKLRIPTPSEPLTLLVFPQL